MKEIAFLLDLDAFFLSLTVITFCQQDSLVEMSLGPQDHKLFCANF